MANRKFKIRYLACVISAAQHWSGGMSCSTCVFALCSRLLMLILYRHDLKWPLNTKHMLAYHLATDVFVGHREDLIKWGWFSINPTLVLEKFKIATHWKTAFLFPFLLQWPHSSGRVNLLLLCCRLRICISGLALADEKQAQDYRCLVDTAMWSAHSCLKVTCQSWTPSFTLLSKEVTALSLGICVSSSTQSILLKVLPHTINQSLPYTRHSDTQY